MMQRIHDEHGGALVEMAISMLIIVPTFMYALFLDDLLRYRLDQQEAVLSTPWDLTTRDYQTGSGHQAAVQQSARLMWCDHTSAYDSYDNNYDCQEGNEGGDGHHSAVGAHVCWLGPGASQVTCDGPNKGFATGFWEPTARAFGRKWTNGGLYSCRGKSNVLNYLLPQEFMQEFADVKMTDKDSYNKGADKVHGTAGGASSGALFTFQEDKFALLTDTWAMTDVPDIKFGKSGPLYERVKTVFRKNPFYWVYAIAGTVFMVQAVAEELISPIALTMNPFMFEKGFLGFDNPFFPAVSQVAGSDSSPPPKVYTRQDSGGGSYHATPWLDWRRNEYQATWNARGKWYLGNTREQTTY